MRPLIVLAVAVLCLVLAGCSHGDFKATIVAQGQAAPHDGFNIGPDTYVTEGQPCKVAGLVIWIKGLTPEDLLGDANDVR